MTAKISGLMTLNNDSEQLQPVQDGVLAGLVGLGVLVGLVEGLDRLLQDGLHRGPHCSHNPLATRTTESAVRSLSAKTRVSSRMMPGARCWSARSISLTLSTRDSGT